MTRVPWLKTKRRWSWDKWSVPWTTCMKTGSSIVTSTPQMSSLRMRKQALLRYLTLMSLNLLRTPVIPLREWVVLLHLMYKIRIKVKKASMNRRVLIKLACQQYLPLKQLANLNTLFSQKLVHLSTLHLRSTKPLDIGKSFFW